MKNNRTKGFTLIEMVMTIAIIGLLMGSVINVIRVNDTKMGVTLEAQKLMAFVRDQQNKAMSVKSGLNETTPKRYCSFGLEVGVDGSGNYFLSEMSASVAANADIDPCTSVDPLTGTGPVIYKFKPGISVTDTVGDGIYFKVPYGATNGATFTVVNQDGLTMKVTVNTMGEIIVTE